MIALMYHDVVSDDAPVSGFAGRAADLYKLPLERFDRQLVAFRAHALDVVPPSVEEDRPSSVVLTFDDGGASASTVIAPRLRELGLTGCFFLAANFVGQRGFLAPSELRTIADQGHIIGSHSLTHPLQMGRCSRQEIRHEWHESKERLEGMLGRAVDVASLPGGYLTRAVAEEAARAGFRILFTSEPTQRVRELEGCCLVGRFAVRRSTPSPVVLAAASGKRLPWMLQRAGWSLRKIVKRVVGPAYLRYRDHHLSAIHSGETETHTETIH